TQDDDESLMHFEALRNRLRIRPVPLDKYGEPILSFVTALYRARDPSIMYSCDVSTFKPGAEAVTDADLIVLFITQWSEIQDLILSGPVHYDALNPDANYDADLRLSAENVAALVTELVNRFPPADHCCPR